VSVVQKKLLKVMENLLRLADPGQELVIAR